MKVLLVTNQYIDIRPDGCYCNFALLGTLENMSVLGELYIVANQQFPDKPAAQPLNQRIDFIKKVNVKHFRPVNRNIYSFLINRKYNQKVLEDCIPNMDLVIGYARMGNGDKALRIAHKYNIPYLTFLVGCPWDTLRNHHRLLARIMAPITYFSTRKTVSESDYVHYVTKSFLQKRYPTRGKSIGCSDINLKDFNVGNLEYRKHKNLSRKKNDVIKLVTTANVDVRYKGQEFVIKAIAKLKNEGESRYHYYLIGAGKGKYLYDLSVQLGVQDHVHFVGRKTTEEVMQILKESDIYLQPSISEGLPRAVVEAMSVALPCIGFNTGGMSELLEPEFVVKQKSVDGIIQCLKSLENVAKYENTIEYNFKNACEYEHSKLVYKIRSFFLEIRNEVESNKDRSNEFDRKNYR